MEHEQERECGLSQAIKDWGLVTTLCMDAVIRFGAGRREVQQKRHELYILPTHLEAVNPSELQIHTVEVHPQN